MNLVFRPFGLERGAKVRSPAILPDDGAVDRFARRAVPDDDRFTLVGKAEGRDAIERDVRRCNRLLQNRDSITPDVFGIMASASGTMPMSPKHR